jgi:hypothetical protein
MVPIAQRPEASSGLGFENGLESYFQRFAGPVRAGTSLPCQDLGRHLGNALVGLNDLPLSGSQEYSGRRSRSYRESAIASPCYKRWSCHNASA